MMINAFVPLIRTMPIALIPGGVASATIVSSQPVNFPVIRIQKYHGFNGFRDFTDSSFIGEILQSLTLR